MSGLAVLILSLGIVTWLPAWAAAAQAQRHWRNGDDPDVFVRTLRNFGRHWAVLKWHAVASTVVIAFTVANATLLVNRPNASLFALGYLGVLLVAIPYHLALAIVSGVESSDPLVVRVRRALWFGFGSVARGTALLGAFITTAIASLIVPIGPLLLPVTVSLAVGLLQYEHEEIAARDMRPSGEEHVE